MTYPFVVNIAILTDTILELVVLFIVRSLIYITLQDAPSHNTPKGLIILATSFLDVYAKVYLISYFSVKMTR